MSMDEDVPSIIERIKQSDDIFEKAKMMQYLRDEESVRPVELAQMLHMQPSYISHYLRLLKLPEIIVDGYYSRLVSSSHLFIIARLHSYDAMVDVYERVLAENLTSAQTEEAVRETLYDTKTTGDRFSETEIAQLKEDLQKLLGDVTVKVVQTRIKSKVTIEAKGSLDKTTKKLRRLLKKTSS